MMKETVSFGSQPQNRPHAASAQMAPRMTPTPKSGNAKIVVLYARMSSVCAEGRRATIRLILLPEASGCFMRIRNSALATPEIKNTPLPSETIETCTGSQYDCSAGTTGAASAYSTVPATNRRINVGTRTNNHRVRSCLERSTTSAASTPAAQVTETNSYMLPHGGRLAAIPRRTIEPTCRLSATITSPSPVRPRRSDGTRRGASGMRPGVVDVAAITRVRSRSILCSAALRVVAS